HGHLPTVANRLEGRADGHFRLPEADVAADETIHGYGSFHVTLYIRSGLLLVGRVLIDEAGLEFVLQVAIGLESESRIALSFGVELDDVEGQRLHFRLRLFLEVLPRRTAQLAHVGRFSTLFAAVFAYTVQAVDAHVQNVVIAVFQANG